MRIDYTLVSESLLQKGLVGCAEVKGSGTDLQGFMVCVYICGAYCCGGSDRVFLL